jgi:phosphoribosylaminoimidazole-succinocarboxamide synthase
MFKVEMVIRGYMSGHAAREYALGKREICGVPMPEGLKENDKFHTAIITPTTKRIMGNMMPIFQEITFCKGIVSEEDYLVLENIPETYFKEELTASRGLILVDTNMNLVKRKEEL